MGTTYRTLLTWPTFFLSMEIKLPSSAGGLDGNRVRLSTGRLSVSFGVSSTSEVTSRAELSVSTKALSLITVSSSSGSS